MDVIFKWFLWTIEFIGVFFILHQSGITIASWFAKKKKHIDRERSAQHKFVCFICAHNEESVVAQIVKTLQDQFYPKHKYDIVVLADNCSDNTANVAWIAGAQVWERFDDTKKSKGYALDWAFNKIWEDELDYDAVCVFDADNLVSKNFLRDMDLHMQDGAEVLQGYLDSKNPKDSWISKSYAFSYWATNRIFQLARQRLGLSAQLGGTGMCISTKVLREHPWGTQSMTEDLEYVARYVISASKPVQWVHDAKVFDEKPLKMKASFVQRTRWARGHIECAFKYSGELFGNILSNLKQGNIKQAFIAFDVVVYLIQPGKIILSAFMIVSFLLSIAIPGIGLGAKPYFWLFTMVMYYGIPLIGLMQEKRLKAALWSFHVYIFALSWIPIFFIAFFTRKRKTWNKTAHTRSVSMDELVLDKAV